jgi:hypothetical protein
MTDDIQVINISDNFGRRSGPEKRKILGSPIEEERRSGRDRRNGTDRRCGADRRDRTRLNYGTDRRGSNERRRSGHDRRDLMML